MATHSEADITAHFPNLQHIPLDELLARPGSVLDNAVKRLLRLNAEHAVSAFQNHASASVETGEAAEAVINAEQTDRVGWDSADLCPA